MKKLFLALTMMLTAASAWAFSGSELTQLLQQPANVQGQFTQQRYLKSLSKPMNSSGKFVLVPKKGLLWQMEKPFETTLRVRSDGIKQWNGNSWISNQDRLTGQSQQIRLFLDLLGGNTQGLEKQFRLDLSGSAQQWTLNLTPKTALMQQIFKNIRISGDNVVRKIEIDEKQGDRSVMQFKQIQTGKALDNFARTAL